MPIYRLVIYRCSCSNEKWTKTYLYAMICIEVESVFLTYTYIEMSVWLSIGFNVSCVFSFCVSYMLCLTWIVSFPWFVVYDLLSDLIMRLSSLPPGNPHYHEISLICIVYYYYYCAVLQRCIMWYNCCKTALCCVSFPFPPVSLCHVSLCLWMCLLSSTWLLFGLSFFYFPRVS